MVLGEELPAYTQNQSFGGAFCEVMRARALFGAQNFGKQTEAKLKTVVAFVVCCVTDFQAAQLEAV